MRTNHNILIISLLLLLGGCLKDEGNYTYTPSDGPVFDFPEQASVSCYEGETAFMEGAFHFEGADSLERLKDLDYEWSIQGIVISGERHLSVPTDSIIKKMGLSSLPSGFLVGRFTLLERSSGMRYIQKIYYYLRPKFSRGQWLILSEEGAGACLSYQRFYQRYEEEELKDYYENYPDIYRERNGEALKGKPVKLIDHGAPNISAAAGATLVLTEQMAVELNNEQFTRAMDLSEQFLEGPPSDFRVVDAFYDKRVTLLATADGRLFRRLYSENYLGGKFLSEPYSVDEKGYEIAFFANGQHSNTTSFRLAYDRLNHRLLLVNLSFTPLGSVMPLQAVGNGHAVQAWDLGEDVEVLAVSEKGESYAGYRSTLFCILFNQGGKTWMADFVVDNNPPVTYGSVPNNSYVKKAEFPGGVLSKENKILITASNSAGTYGRYLFYTKGNELRYVHRSYGTDHHFITLDARIMTYHFDTYLNRYKELAVGLENGDFLRINVRDYNNPSVIEASRFNVGGKIVSISNTGAREYYAE